MCFRVCVSVLARKMCGCAWAIRAFIYHDFRKVSVKSAVQSLNCYSSASRVKVCEWFTMRPPPGSLDHNNSYLNFRFRLLDRAANIPITMNTNPTSAVTQGGARKLRNSERKVSTFFICLSNAQPTVTGCEGLNNQLENLRARELLYLSFFFIINWPPGQCYLNMLNLAS